jgi:hypothetical protein
MRKLSLRKYLNEALLLGSVGAAGAAAALEEWMEPTFGVAALALKPSVLGGFEACAAVRPGSHYSPRHIIPFP